MLDDLWLQLLAFSVISGVSGVFFMLDLRSVILLPAAFAAVLALTSACETAPPVQEMSDARQAIAVAREAGPADAAAQELATAETYLESAQQKLNERDYQRARSDAIEAKARALRALKLSESSDAPPFN